MYIPASSREQKGALKIWSAGCSYGAEPYSLAILLDQISPGKPHTFHATDLDQKILAKAKEGRFTEADVKNLDTALIERYFTRLQPSGAAMVPDLAATFCVKPEIRSRVADSIETALRLSQGLVLISVEQPDGKWVDAIYSEKFACPEHPQASLPELEPRLFSFNSPHGACPSCHGLGTLSEFDADMIVPDESLSLENGAIEAWRKNGKRMNIYYSRVLRQFAKDFGINYSGPYKDIPKKARDILMHGSDKKGDGGTGTWFEGIIPNLQRRFETTESEWVKHRLHGCMSEQPCNKCNGKRLKIEALSVRIQSTIDPMEARSSLTVRANESSLAVEASEDEAVAKKSAKVGNFGKSVKKEVKTKSAAKSIAIEAGDGPLIPGYSIDDVTRMTVEQAREFFSHLKLGEEGVKIA